MVALSELQEAAELVHRHLLPSPQINWPLLAQRTGAEVWVKHENHLPTGAFKVRGGVVLADRLSRSNPGAGIISATRGNHGQSLGWAGARFGLHVTIVVPHGNSREKNAAMRACGVRLIEHGEDFEAAREEALRLATTDNLTFIPSFAPELVLGVATYAYELFNNAPPLDAVYVPIGLGSGICGTILARNLLGLTTQIIGVQSSGADPYARSLAADGPVTINRAETRADGIAVRQPDPDALRIIRDGAQRIVTVPDQAIAAAIQAYWTDTHNLIEGAGAAPLAALIQEADWMSGRRIGLIASGGNIDLDVFRDWVR
jgi:threonine dehydratase